MTFPARLIAVLTLLALAACGVVHPASGPPRYNQMPMGGGGHA